LEGKEEEAASGCSKPGRGGGSAEKSSESLPFNGVPIVRVRASVGGMSFFTGKGYKLRFFQKCVTFEKTSRGIFAITT
jgi:hypothetical protein